ncbi:MAG: hypothetical protein EB078_04810 [Proteobacteria bacterium]|nr:hypothetical protein [Pseudomonadota bacterium]NDD04204.1 hypothetical protein [Pseudomonadota bacterium]
MKTISLLTGLNKEDLSTGESAINYFTQKSSGLKVEVVSAKFDEYEDSWVVDLRTSKKNLVELMIRVDHDDPTQSTSHEEIEEIAREIWAAA